MPRGNASLSRPRGLRRPAAIVLALVVAAAWIVPGCGTDAVGVEACRRIELARCDVAPACVGFEGSPAIETDDQVRNCRVFYRDHCLLGLENIEADPGQGDVDACVEAIRTTAACGSPTRSTIEACGVALRPGADVTLAPCAVLQVPHELQACAWLNPPEEDDGGGGAGATSTATAGTTTTAASTSTGDAATSSTSTGAIDDGF